MFLKGAKGGLRATDEIYDLLIEEDCKVGDHSHALEISYEMEAAGRMATTFHFNCLLSVQVTLFKYWFLITHCTCLCAQFKGFFCIFLFFVQSIMCEVFSYLQTWY